LKTPGYAGRNKELRFRKIGDTDMREEVNERL